MIVLFGRADDAPLAMVRAALAERDAPVVFLEQARLASYEFRLEVGPCGVDGELMADGHRLRLAGVRAAYARILGLPSQRDALASARAEAFQEAFLQWLDLAPALIVNRPARMESNASKPYQGQQIARAGFRVPATLVTNDPEAVREFQKRTPRLVYKSVSGVRSIVKELTDGDMARLDRVRGLPVQFQEYVAGDDIRVHVAGARAFATLIESGATDYRYAGRDGLEAQLSAIDLPAEVVARCVALAAELELPLCGIDLRRTPSGEYVCFEANPMPAFSYYESHTGAPIAATIAEMLLEAADGERT
ncbi:MAG: alpha-L-glutamate ligase [Dehalococcoidia bacterium]